VAASRLVAAAAEETHQAEEVAEVVPGAIVVEFVEAGTGVGKPRLAWVPTPPSVANRR